MATKKRRARPARTTKKTEPAPVAPAAGPDVKNFDIDFGKEKNEPFLLFGVEHTPISTDTPLFALRSAELQAGLLKVKDELGEFDDSDEDKQVAFITAGVNARVGLIVAVVPSLDDYTEKMNRLTFDQLDELAEFVGIEEDWIDDGEDDDPDDPADDEDEQTTQEQIVALEGE